MAKSCKNACLATNIPKDVLLVTADVVGLHPNIPHDVGLRTLREVLD